MPKLSLVTIGTDGVIDYVQTSDGRKYALGPVSVLKLITGLVSARVAKAALEEFNEQKQVLLPIDLDKMWSLLPFRRARYSSFTNPLMKKGFQRCSLSLKGSQFSDSERTMLKTASYETFTSNVELAEDIIAKVATTNSRIDELLEKGKQFDSARARLDLHKIAAQVAEIAQNVDLAYSWVSNDLEGLSKKANEIHKLFEG
jgi:hypothetical protein